MKLEENLNLIITTADFVILMVDQSGKIVSANPAIRRVFGLQEGEVEGKKLIDLIPDLDLLSQMEFNPVEARGGMDSFDNHEIATSDCTYLEALAAKEIDGDHHEVQIMVETAEGNKTRWIELSTCKLLQDQQLMFTLIINDISRRKQNERKINDLNQSLEQKVLERTAELEARTKQVKKIVNSCGDELKTINQTYQMMKERQMDIMENMEKHVTDNITGLSPEQEAQIQQAVRSELIACMNLYSEDQITDQKFLLAIITLNELFEGKTKEQDNLKPGQLSGTSQDEVDDLLGSLGI